MPVMSFQALKSWEVEALGIGMSQTQLLVMVMDLISMIQTMTFI